MKYRFLSAAAAAAVTLSLCSVMVSADGTRLFPDSEEFVDSGICGENLIWTLDGSGTLVISGSGNMDLMGVGYKRWSSHNEKIRNVIIEEGVKDIAHGAFSDCSNLSSITISNGITRIGGNAFRNCSSLSSVNLPNGVVSIGSYAFSECTSLSDIIIPDSVAEIDTGAFSGCRSLDTIDIPESITAISSYLFYQCKNLSSVTIPDRLLDIGNYAFYRCGQLSAITIPNSVESIGDKSFYECESLSTVLLPDNITSIENSSFEGCIALKEIVIPESVTQIGKLAFAGCTNLEKITIPLSVERIGQYAFSGCTCLESAIIPNKDCIIFDDLNTFDNGVLIYGDLNSTAEAYARKYNLAFAEIAGGIIEKHGSCGEYQTWVLDNEGTLLISGSGQMNNWNFDNSPWCSVSEKIYQVKIEEGINSLGMYAFRDCKNLESIIIPSSVTYFGKTVLLNCSNLKKITILNSQCQIDFSSDTISEDALICGYVGSTAEKYAKRNERQFVPLEGAAERTKGDADGDGAVTNKDAQYVLTAYTESLTTGVTDMPEADAKAADVDGSGSVGAADAQYILVYYTENTIAGNKTTWEMLITS